MEQPSTGSMHSYLSPVERIAGCFDYLLGEKAGFQELSGNPDDIQILSVSACENIPIDSRLLGEYRVSRVCFEAQIRLDRRNHRRPVQESHTLVFDKMVEYRETVPIDHKTGRVDRRALHDWDEMRRQRLLLAAGRIIDSLFRAE